MLASNPKIISAAFYATAGGGEPVRDWLKKLNKADRSAIGVEIKTVEFGWPLGMPLVRAMTGHDRLWEVRLSLSGNRIARVLFTVHNNRMILLHGFIKKSKATPNADLVLADKRKREVQRGN
jgi:phage-related protein